LNEILNTQEVNEVLSNDAFSDNKWYTFCTIWTMDGECV
jgi:hypothetical protein